MARKPASRVRAGQRGIQPKVPVVRGLSGSAQRDIARLERLDNCPGAVARALARWSRFVHQPQRTLVTEADNPCPCCWPDGDHERRTLDRYLHRLPRQSARELRAQVDPLDDLLLARTVPDPNAGAGLPWWERRA